MRGRGCWVMASGCGAGATLGGWPPAYKVLYSVPMADAKPVVFRGSSLDDLRAFPGSARREAGYQLHKVQHGADPSNWKPMGAIGRGVREIRIHDAGGAFRVVYVASFAAAVYVLHCFPKKTQKTRNADLELAAKRYRDLAKEMGS